MKSTQENIVNFLEKAYELTQLSLKAVQEKEFSQLNHLLDNRERALSIVNSLSENLALMQKNQSDSQQAIEFNHQLNKIIEKINSMDDLITLCLKHEKDKTQFEIAKNHKNKENFKGYNLNNLK